MDAGNRDQPVFFEQPTKTNVGGEMTITWADASGTSPPTPDWAKVLSEKGSEAFESARQNAKETIRLMVLYRDDVKTTWRVKFNDVYYYIKYVDHTMRRKGELWITAEALGAL